MTNTKDNIQRILLEKGRELVQEKGADYLTARKLSEASGYSVGTIYNQFANMDNFILAQNMRTLDELYDYLSRLLKDSNDYKNLNRYLDGFVSFVLANPNLWFLLYRFHLQSEVTRLPKPYLRKLVKITGIWEPSFNSVFGNLSIKERRLSMQVLWVSLFSLSSFLTTKALDNFSKLNKKTVSKLLLNTYLAGLSVLKKG